MWIRTLAAAAVVAIINVFIVALFGFQVGAKAARGRKATL